jgi:hypothetical protein
VASWATEGEFLFLILDDIIIIFWMFDTNFLFLYRLLLAIFSSWATEGEFLFLILDDYYFYL